MKSYFIVAFLVAYVSCDKKAGLEIITEFKPAECSKTAANGDTVAVHYTGKLENGKIFDSSVVSKRDPIQFTLGEKKVIPGWEKGIVGMCVGEKRKLVIPPELAYGAAGAGNIIPPHATLSFETELMALEKKEVTTEVYDKLLTFIQVAMWPAIALLLLVILYLRIGSAEEEERLAKAEKKGKKKKN